MTRPDIAYARGSDGHLVPLAAAAAASTAAASGGARALLSQPRSDFPLAAESKLLMRAPKGEAYVAGLVSAPAGALQRAGPRLSLAAQAADASGKAGRERGARGRGVGPGRRLASSPRGDSR